MLDSDKLYNSYRLCSIHFEKKMFTNPNMDRLKHNADPTLFPDLERSSSTSHDHTYSLFLKPIKLDSPPSKVRILDNRVIIPAQVRSGKNDLCISFSKNTALHNLFSETFRQNVFKILPVRETS